MKLFRALLLAGAMFSSLSAAAEARTLGLLVGVADYNEESGIKDLLGPRNDVSILWRALKARGASPADITVLADNLPPGPDFPVAAGLPQAANILGALDQLAKTAQPGDTVLFYYSGHGTRQPDNPKDQEEEPELDGMDQVLLPSDVGKFDARTGSLKNAIVDDVLGKKIEAIRKTGALVWAVVDACHSGTVTRGDTITRSVNPDDLGIPPAPAATAASRGDSRKGTMRASRPEAGEGGLVGFYAVESYTEAIERPFPGYNLPMAGEGEKQRMGVFTYLLHRALTRNDASTFRDLAQEIVAELNSDRTGGKVPPPVFDGDLDAPVPGSDGSRIPNSANGVIESGKITFPVGSLQGFDSGAGISLYAPGKPEAVIGHAAITEATAVTSTAEEIEWEGGVTPLDKATVSAVVTDPAINFRFVVSPPPAADAASDGERAAVDGALAKSFDDAAEALGISLGEPGNPDADVLLRLKNDRVWIVRPDRPWVETAGAYDETPSLPLDMEPEAFAAELKAAIWSLARATKLIRVTSALGENATADDGIVVKATLTRAAEHNSKAACNSEGPPPGAEAQPLDPLMPAAASNCDMLNIEVTNDSDLDYFIAGFYVDSLGGVAAFPRSAAERGCSRSLAAGTGKPLKFKLFIDTWDEGAGKPSSVGAENFVVLAVPKDQTKQPPKLCSLTQPALTALQSKRSATKSADSGKKSKLASLIGAVEGDTTRGSSGASEDGGPPMSGRLFVFDVKP